MLSEVALPHPALVLVSFTSEVPHEEDLVSTGAFDVLVVELLPHPLEEVLLVSVLPHEDA